MLLGNLLDYDQKFYLLLFLLLLDNFLQLFSLLLWQDSWDSLNFLKLCISLLRRQNEVIATSCCLVAIVFTGKVEFDLSTNIFSTSISMRSRKIPKNSRYSAMNCQRSSPSAVSPFRCILVVIFPLYLSFYLIFFQDIKISLFLHRAASMFQSNGTELLKNVNNSHLLLRLLLAQSIKHKFWAFKSESLVNFQNSISINFLHCFIKFSDIQIFISETWESQFVALTPADDPRWYLDQWKLLVVRAWAYRRSILGSCTLSVCNHCPSRSDSEYRSF